MANIFIRGNSKLGKDVLIFNLPPGGKGGTCRPTQWCIQHCYAMKGLHMLPSVIKANASRKVLADQADFPEKAIAELKRTKKNFVRIHAAGDFYSEEYVNKWIEICKACPEKRFLAYTKSRHLKTSLLKLARLSNVSLYESLDSTREQASTPFLRAMLDDMKLASAQAANKRTKETMKCPGECDPCGYKCWDRDKHVIFHKH